jgi:arsenite-transporting ATPase
VGKTTVASATAVRLADSGKQVLLVSTDPASNLDEVLGLPLSSRPSEASDLPGLWAMNLDPEAAAGEYRKRMVEPYRNVLPEDAVRAIEEQFTGSCTMEIAAFDEFARLLVDESARGRFDHLIFDTAPTGHTLRLLSLPAAWSAFIDTNTTGTSCLGPVAGLQGQRECYRQAVRSLSDSAKTTLVLVTRPESAALREAERTSHELSALGVRNQHLVINAIFEARDRRDAHACAMQQQSETAVRDMPPRLRRLPRTEIPLAPRSILGLEQLRRFGGREPVIAEEPATPVPAPFDRRDSSFVAIVDSIAAMGSGVVMMMGKGGVGKTTIAAALAVALAEKGLPVHLTTTDPAAHVREALNDTSLPSLTVGRIDPKAVTQEYADNVMRTVGAGLDQQGRALLAEDLRSPCTEEIAVFRAFAEAVGEGERRLVILDTAPTGHTILLLDAARSYHREVARQGVELPRAVERLLPRLRQPEYTRAVLVTVPEATPVHEAEDLQRDLRRAGIEPFAWVINQSLIGVPVTDPVLRKRQHSELPFIQEVIEHSGNRFAVVPWQAQPTAGPTVSLRIANGESLTVSR